MSERYTITVLSRFAAFGVLISLVLSGASGQVAFRTRKLAAPARSVVAAPIPFRAIGYTSPSATVQLRASTDGIHWTPWLSGQPDGGGGGLVFFGELYRYVETASSSTIDLWFIDPGVTPGGPLRRTNPHDAPPAAPPIVSRAQWGCTPEACPLQSPPQYTTVTHLIVHHTDGANDATDWPAVVRSIWVLHVQVNGWNDIGYNYLIDPNGVIYEGRAGGDGVLGAHFSCVNSGTMGVAMLGTYSSVPLPAAAAGALRVLLAWQAAKWNLDPTGKQLHAASGLILDTISGHRDANLSPAACGPTECPGNGAYTELAALRTEVSSLMAGACLIVVSGRNYCAPAGGGHITVPITAPPRCGWQAASTLNWAQPQTTTSGVVVDVQPNPGGRRSGAVMVAGHALTITQAANGEGPLPCVASDGVVNAASDSGRPVVAGSLVSIYGSNLAARETSAAPAAALPTTLGGVSVAVDGRAASLLYVSPTLINLLLPAATAIGSGRAVITVNGLIGPAAPFSVTESLPAIFLSQDGRAVAQNDVDGRLNGPSAPVAPGGGLTIYLTGLNASLPATASIGGRPARVLSSGAAAGSPGVFKIDLLVPADTDSGDQPVLITASGAVSLPAPITVAH